LRPQGLHATNQVALAVLATTYNHHLQTCNGSSLYRRKTPAGLEQNTNGQQYFHKVSWGLEKPIYNFPEKTTFGTGGPGGAGDFSR
jgi:hypothetical protein